MDWLLQLLTANWKPLALFGAALGWYAFQNRAALWAMLPKGVPSIGGEVDPDVEDVAALKRLQARADRNKCPKAKAAIDEFGRHFFECGEHE